MTDERLRMVAEIGDGFTGPLGKLEAGLRRSAQVGTQVGKDLKKDFDAFHGTLNKTTSVLQSMAPTLSVLGAGGLVAGLGLGSITAALRGFSTGTQQLSILSKETGLAVDQLRAFGSLGDPAGVAAAGAGKLDKAGDPSAVPALGGIKAPAFGGIPTRIIIGNNPDGQQGWTDQRSKNPISLLVDVGGYGAPSFSSLSVPEAITGAIKVPASATNSNHSSGVAGYASTYSTSPNHPGAVGVYGQGDVMATGASAWGFNTRTQDNGFTTPGLWGYEIDINVSGAGTLARGLDIVGGSTAQLDGASPGIIIQTPGLGSYGTPTPIRWGRGILINDESALTGIEMGSSRAIANNGSLPITFMYRDGSNTRNEAFRIYATGPDGAIEATTNGGLLRLRGDVGGVKQNTLTVQGPNVGIGASAPALPAYPLDVYGNARFTGNIGFGGATPVTKPTLPAAATDAASTQALVNAIRAALIAVGLAQ